MTKLVCYLDLDGVLVDFVRGALQAHNKYLPPKDIRWGFPAQIGFTETEDPAFWAPMGFHFWANLPWTVEGLDLLRKLEDIFGPNIVLLTSPATNEGSVEGKVEWVRRNIPEYSRRLMVGPCKHLMAGPNKLLIDDHDDNVIKFREHLGHTVLVPRPWNSARELTNDDGYFSVNTMILAVDAIVRIIEAQL